MKKSEAELLKDQWTSSMMETDPEVLAKYVLYDVDEARRTATITFNRPEKYNAIPVAGLELVGDYVKQAEVDDRVKVIVFKGVGPCFGTAITSATEPAPTRPPSAGRRSASGCCPTATWSSGRSRRASRTA
jgi:enoyl-CoA hydratase